jgi:phosphatidylinositol glycan class M
LAPLLEYLCPSPLTSPSLTRPFPQYFLWYLILLPLHLPHSTLLSNPRLGLLAASLWVLTQVCFLPSYPLLLPSSPPHHPLITTQASWLQQAYTLEFLGQSTFFPGLFVAGLAFFAVNCWVLGIMVRDVGGMGGGGVEVGGRGKGEGKGREGDERGGRRVKWDEGMR